MLFQLEERGGRGKEDLYTVEFRQNEGFLFFNSFEETRDFWNRLEWFFYFWQVFSSESCEQNCKYSSE